MNIRCWRTATTITALMLGLTACSSVPLSTMMRFRNADQSMATQLQPADIRVRFSVPADFALKPDSTTLKVAMTSAVATFTGNFGLDMLDESVIERDGGWFSASQSLRRYTFALRPPSQATMSATLATLKAPLESLQFNVGWAFDTWPADKQDVQIWVDIKLADEEDYFTLLDGATIKAGS